MCTRVPAPAVCMQGVCPCSNPVITRPGAPEAEERKEGWVGRGEEKWDGQRPKVEQGV